ncbi:MAG: hypothetical protein KDK24_20370 [Pseudooceanicola sp.]|nr:hypothetical protein [Pseudooceanicola sp.]
MKVRYPRRKPHPVPPIHPVPDYAAGPALTQVYQDTRSVLQVPWMGVVTMAFAHYPNFWGTLWRGLRPLAQSEEFVAGIKRLRRVTESTVAAIPTRDMVAALEAAGYGEREIAEIRALVEVFSHGNMPYLLIATAARLLLEGAALSDTRTVTRSTARHAPPAPEKLILMEPHHADAATVRVYNEIRRALGLPFVNTDYRALARWPSYFRLAWDDLRPMIGSVDHMAAVDVVHGEALTLMAGLPNPGGLTPEALQAAAERDASLEEVLEVVRLFQFLLPELAVNVAIFRAQLGG